MNNLMPSKTVLVTVAWTLGIMWAMGLTAMTKDLRTKVISS